MFCWRITKYNPKFRNDLGHYTKDEWSYFGQIHQIFEGKKFTIEEYLKVEMAYIEALLKIMDCLGITELQVVSLSKKGKIPKCDSMYTKEMIDLYNKIHEGMAISKEVIPLIVKLILRENLGCKLEAKEMYVHFGWDFYMYIGSNIPCNEALKEIEKSGLFVEPFASPYSDDE